MARASDGQRVVDRLHLRLVQTGRDLLMPVVEKPAKGLIAVGGIDFGLAEADPFRDRATRRSTLAGLHKSFATLWHSKEEVETIADLYQDARSGETVKVAEGTTPTKGWLMALPPPGYCILPPAGRVGATIAAR